MPLIYNVLMVMSYFMYYNHIISSIILGGTSSLDGMYVGLASSSEYEGASADFNYAHVEYANAT